ncbi:MAG: hypothetical protein HC933_03845 [Pleurocapsa sp. SU_196_0]|nr:hypothetical protein [Pleurocapsa sp. SU_196_0]
MNPSSDQRTANHEAELQTRISRMLELPKLLERAGRQIVAQRAERRTLERKLETLEASIRVRLIEQSTAFQALKNQADREAYLRDSLAKNSEWTFMRDRLESLTTAIEKAVSDKDALEHERKALKAALEREYAAIIERVLTDRQIAEAVARGGRVVA